MTHDPAVAPATAGPETLDALIKGLIDAAKAETRALIAPPAPSEICDCQSARRRVAEAALRARVATLEARLREESVAFDKMFCRAVDAEARLRDAERDTERLNWLEAVDGMDADGALGAWYAGKPLRDAIDLATRAAPRGADGGD